MCEHSPLNTHISWQVFAYVVVRCSICPLVPWAYLLSIACRDCCLWNELSGRLKPRLKAPAGAAKSACADWDEAKSPIDAQTPQPLKPNPLPLLRCRD